jgi:hypothetical protein
LAHITHCSRLVLANASSLDSGHSSSNKNMNSLARARISSYRAVCVPVGG